MADTLKPLNCPACGKEMEKVLIPSEGINLDICTEGCGGIYFDNREFSKFDEQHEDISEILAKLENKSFVRVDESQTRLCPNCGAKMVKNYSSIKKSIEVDECYTCGGKFLDNSELVKIRQEYLNDEERSADVINYVYQTVGSELKEHHSKHSTIKQSALRSLFGKLTGF